MRCCPKEEHWLHRSYSHGARRLKGLCWWRADSSFLMLKEGGVGQMFGNGPIMKLGLFSGSTSFKEDPFHGDLVPKIRGYNSSPAMLMEVTFSLVDEALVVKVARFPGMLIPFSSLLGCGLSSSPHVHLSQNNKVTQTICCRDDGEFAEEPSLVHEEVVRGFLQIIIKAGTSVDLMENSGTSGVERVADSVERPISEKGCSYLGPNRILISPRDASVSWYCSGDMWGCWLMGLTRGFWPC